MLSTTLGFPGDMSRRSYLSLLFTYLYERALNHRMVKSKIFEKSSLNFSFGQGSYLISDFT